MKNTFLDKLLNRIDRVGQGDLQAYLQRLNNEKGFFETIFNTLQEGIVVVDARGRIKYLNHASTTLLGIDPLKAMGTPMAQHLKELDWPKILAEGRVVNRDLEVFYPQPRYLNFYLVPLEEKDASLLGYAIIFHDLTAHRAQARETIESEKLNAVTLLAAGVAHEIGNPLNSLHIHLQLMERKVKKLKAAADKRELQDSIDIARAEINRLDSIVTQFLRAVRPSKPNLQPENVNEIVREAVRFFRPEITDRDFVVETELRSDLPRLELDRDQIKQAFYNAIKNSFEAMKRRDILRIRTDRDETHVKISFSDTGGGISAENLSRVFEPYFTTKSGGSGLGLLIVRRIVREHGGELAIESSEGKGLTLTIRLPFLDRRVRMLPEKAEG